MHSWNYDFLLLIGPGAPRRAVFQNDDTETAEVKISRTADTWAM